eukprot:3327793-Alexandrium_andersonii.AAC.1
MDIAEGQLLEEVTCTPLLANKGTQALNIGNGHNMERQGIMKGDTRPVASLASTGIAQLGNLVIRRVHALALDARGTHNRPSS